MAVGLALLAPGLAAAAWDGSTAPNDPGYAPAEKDPVSKCINDEQWYLFSFLPKCTPLAKDPEGSSGMFVDQAWRQFTNGRPDVTIAYVEAGPNWHNQTARDELGPRAYLNVRELPKPYGSSRYDKNGDGQVNIQDYAGDPRIKQPYHNGGQLTVEDLILAFSNGRDDDRNGYVDDISGWNFFRANNDPATGDSAYGHSDSQMRRAAAEGNNGVAQVGLCPRCTVLPIKAGDEALDRTDEVAQSVYFATDSGASVIVLLDAELGYSSLTRAALDYAWGKGVVVVGASNDFDSADHQNGMFWPRVWPGNGLQSDASGTVQQQTKSDHLARTFRARSNETSFGTHSLFSTPDGGGSTSESTPTNAGVAALVAAEGRDAAAAHKISRRLDAGEIKQVVRATASNIADPTLGWPGKPGATFNVQYGYGRPNVLKALRAVANDRIPPVPDILGPRWYQLFDPTRTAAIPVTVDLRARRGSRIAYKVQYGLGPDPTEAQFHTIAAGHVAGRHGRGTLARLALARIPKSFWQRPLHYTTDLSSTEQHTVTFRVQATDGAGNMGEDRRAVAVFHDPSLAPGYPRYLGQGKEAQPELYDLNGDGRLDMVFGDADGFVHALDRGRELPGFPVATNRIRLGLARTPAGRAGAVPAAHEPVLAPAAIGDIDGDGRPEIAVTSTSGRLYVFDARGRRLPGFPHALGTNVRGYPVPPPERPYTRAPSMGAFAPPVLVRLPGSSSRLDVLQAAWDGKLYAFDGHGRAVPGWPVFAQLPASARPKPPFADVHDYKLVATPTIADLNGDGKPEVVIKSQEYDYSNDPSGLGFFSRFYVLAYWGDGNRHPGGALVPGFPARLQGTLGYYGSAQDWITEGGDSASAADVNGDGRDEVIQSTVFGVPQTIHGDGSVTPLAPQPNPAAVLLGSQPPPGTESVPTSNTAAFPVTFTESGSFARFGGGLAYLSAGEDLASVSALVHNGIAQRITNFMRAYDGSSGATRPGFPAPMMGLPFITAPAVADISGDGKPDVVNAEDTSNVAAFEAGGAPVPGWPKFTGGWTIETPAVGDLNGDGRNEVVATSREGYLFVWRTPGRASSSEAWSWHQDDWHTGRYGTDTRPPSKPLGLRLVKPGRVCWTAPGDDWRAGRAAAYQVRALRRPPGPRVFRNHVLPGVPRPALAGRRQCVTVPARARWLAIRAIDDAGLRSRTAVLHLP